MIEAAANEASQRPDDAVVAVVGANHTSVTVQVITAPPRRSARAAVAANGPAVRGMPRLCGPHKDNNEEEEDIAAPDVAAAAPDAEEKNKGGRPKKGKGRRKNKSFYKGKRKKEGSERIVKRAAARGARSRTAKSLSPQALPSDAEQCGERQTRGAIAVLIKRNHLGAKRSDWPEIAADIATQVSVAKRTVLDVFEKMAEGEDAAGRHYSKVWGY